MKDPHSPHPNMRRKHKKGVVSSMYDYIFFLHPSSSDPRATILLVSDAGCLTMYKRARYFRLILNLAFACGIIRVTYTHTHTCIICTERAIRRPCRCVRVRMSAGKKKAGSRTAPAHLWPPHPAEGHGRGNAASRPSTSGAPVPAVKGRFSVSPCACNGTAPSHVERASRASVSGL